MPQIFYTEEEFRANEQQKIALCRIVNSFTDAISQEISSKDKNEKTWHYISLYPGEFLDQITFVRNDIIKRFGNIKHKEKFVDLGCGIGDKIYLARQFNFNTTGIEISDNAIELSRKYFHDLNIIKEDINNINISEYDVIYYYCPFKNFSLQKAFEQRIEKEMRPGTYLIANLKQDNSIVQNKEFIRLNSHVYYKLKKTKLETRKCSCQRDPKCEA